jgi:hypothetical protein
MMKWWWNGGVERKANPLLRECWTFLIHIFLHQQWKQCLEFALAKLREICKYLASAIQTVMPVGYTILLLSAKQSRENQCNKASRLKKMYQKSLALSIHFEMRRSPFANWIHYICRQKTTTSLWNLDRKGNWRKKELRSQANNAQYNTQGGGGAAPLHGPGEK